MKKIEIKEVCQSCKGTGLYSGFAERDGFAVVCKSCDGTGCHHFYHEYEDFVERKESKGIKRVLQANPGISVGVNASRGLTIESYGGVPYEEWSKYKNPISDFPPKTEMRRCACPAWYYQSIDYKKKPSWKECIGCGAFTDCESFEQKERCWKKWDKEYSK